MAVATFFEKWQAVIRRIPLTRRSAPKPVELSELERRILTHIGRGECYLSHVGHPDNWPRAVSRLIRLGLIDHGDRYGDNRAITEAGRRALGAS